MMDRRTFNACALGGLAAAPWHGHAQPVQKVPVVGVLQTAAVSPLQPAFIQGMRELGYVDGRNVVIDVRSAKGEPRALPGLANELVQRKVDVIYTTGPASIAAAMAATRTTPIVAFDLETEPVQAGWAQSLARPGGNLTGVFLDLPAMAGKWLQFLREASPSVKRVGLLWDSTSGSGQLNAAKSAARGLGIELTVMEISRPSDFEPTLNVGLSAGVRALVQLSSPLVSVLSDASAALVIKHRLPATSLFRQFAVAGGLLSYGPNRTDMHHRAAAYVDKILRGAKPGELAIEQPTKFELVINLKSAKALGLTIPQSLLLRADEVIE